MVFNSYHLITVQHLFNFYNGKLRFIWLAKFGSINLNVRHVNGMTHFVLESINLNVQHVNGMTHFDLKSINLNAEDVNGMTDLVLRLLGTVM